MKVQEVIEGDKPGPDPEILELIRSLSRQAGIAQRQFTDEEIIERALCQSIPGPHMPPMPPMPLVSQVGKGVSGGPVRCKTTTSPPWKCTVPTTAYQPEAIMA